MCAWESARARAIQSESGRLTRIAYASYVMSRAYVPYVYGLHLVQKSRKPPMVMNINRSSILARFFLALGLRGSGRRLLRPERTLIIRFTSFIALVSSEKLRTSRFALSSSKIVRHFTSLFFICHFFFGANRAPQNVEGFQRYFRRDIILSIILSVIFSHSFKHLLK